MLSSKNSAITGLGGVGKTQIALELAYRVKNDHPTFSVFWVPATTVENFEQAYLGIGRLLKIPGITDEKADIKLLVKQHLSQDNIGKWLLVVDNADDIDIWFGKENSSEAMNLISFLPKSSQGVVLFTTRNRKAAVKLAQSNVIEVSEISAQTATELLEKLLIHPKAMDDKQATLTLFQRLEHLPLAIVQAAAYINENGIRVSDYLSLLDDTEETVIEILSEDFEDESRYKESKNPVATTWLISFDQIRQRYALAADYLSFMSCMDSRNIPQSLLPPAPSNKAMVDAIGTLDAYSFLTRRPEDQSFDLHRLVHLTTRNWLQEEGLLTRWTDRAVSQLARVFPTGEHASRPVWKAYLPHARYVLASNAHNGDLEDAISLRNKVGFCLLVDGKYSEAEELFVQVVETRKRVLGMEHPDTLLSIGNLASTYWNQGRWKEAEELDLQVMETRKRVLGTEHPDTLASIGNLASTYRNQGRWKEAEELELQVIEMRKRVLGTEHPHTLASIGNLASTYRNQGRWKEAEDLELQVIEMRKRVLGMEHPDTLASIGNLALTYWNQGRLKEAEDLELQVMEMRKRVLGVEHPGTLLSIGNLASTYRNQGRLKEAEELELQVMEMRKRVLGVEHPNTLISMNNLAYNWKLQGRDHEALALMEECVQLRIRVLGPNHPHTTSSLEALNEWQMESLDLEPTSDS
jgi:tetratricopeptide (TPR) repeat protein